MKIKLTILLSIFFFTFFSSCNKSNLIADSKIANEVIHEVNGNGGQFNYIDLPDEKDENKKHFIELNIEKCALLSAGFSKYDISSYCATQLYKRLNPKSLENKFGINIVFDNEDIAGKKLYLYKKNELELAWKAFDNVSNFMDLINKNNYDHILSYFDTSYYHLKLPKIIEYGKNINQKISSKKYNLLLFYDYLDTFNSDSTKKHKCFAILCLARYSDGSFSSFSFLCPMYEAESRIIYYDFIHLIEKKS
jgi:hypothetical protein